MKRIIRIGLNGLLVLGVLSGKIYQQKMPRSL